MSSIDNFYRFKKISPKDGDERSEYRRDYCRVLHSAAFRRLVNKTQLFPGYESDFFRNRLTHSLEVAQISKSIAQKFSNKYPDIGIEPDVCEISGLLHDIGHPPFGHNGESALDSCMTTYGGFEGNAQTLRIITKLEKYEYSCIDGKQDCVGLNLTARSIASVLKYDKVIPQVRQNNKELVKGYYKTEGAVVDTIKSKIAPSGYEGNFKTIECSIMDLADDIAYSTYDVEDAFKAEFLTPYSMMAADEYLLKKICDKLKETEKIELETKACRTYLIDIFEDVWHRYRENGNIAFEEDENRSDLHDILRFLSSYNDSLRYAQNGYFRTQFTSNLVNNFIGGIHFIPNHENPLLSRVEFDEDTLTRVAILKHFSYTALINSSRLRVAENRGSEIIARMFDKLASNDGYNLLPEDYQKKYRDNRDELTQKRIVCDFIAGMTDRYAMEFYCRLFSENPQTIFKPI